MLKKSFLPFLFILGLTISCNMPRNTPTSSSRVDVLTPLPLEGASKVTNTSTATPVHVENLLPSIKSPEPTKSPTPILSPTRKPTRTPSPTPTKFSTIPPFIAHGPDNFPADVNPLTGLQVPDTEILERRPIAIKIPNFPRSVRPQWGLSLADIVYEYYLEFGMSRFIALFYGNDASQVGPIRSARFFDEHIVRMYKSIFVFNSADDQIIDYLSETDLVNYFVLERDITPLWRDTTVVRPNNLFANTGEISLYIEEREIDNNRQDLTGSRFLSLAMFGGQPARELVIKYSPTNYLQWVYNQESKQYLRFQENQDANEISDESFEQLTDQLNGDHISASNIVVLLVPHTIYLKSSDTEIFEIHPFGYGDAFVFRNGNLFPAQWVRMYIDKPLLIIHDGTPFPFQPGNTWYQVINVGSKVLQEDDSWRFEFAVP